MRYLFWVALACMLIPLSLHAQEKEAIDLTLRLDLYTLYSALADTGSQTDEKHFSSILSGYSVVPIAKETPKIGTQWLKENLKRNLYLLPTLRIQTIAEKRPKVRCPTRRSFRICTTTVSLTAGNAVFVINWSPDTRSVNFGMAGERGISVSRSRKSFKTITTLRLSRRLKDPFKNNQDVIGMRVRFTF